MPVKQIKRHSLDDIRAVMIKTDHAPVTPEGAAKVTFAKLKRVEMRGYTCLRCVVDFQQWRAVIAHLDDMLHKEEREARQMLSGMPSVLKGGRKRNRKHIIPVEMVVDIVRFSRDVLDLRISETMARAVAVLLRNPTEIPHVSLARSQAMRIAAEYKAVKG